MRVHEALAVDARSLCGIKADACRLVDICDA